jgi:hypothetical protein
MSKIIGICGLIGSGKGTVADMLVESGYKKISFADKLKDGVSAIFGWDRAMLEGDTVESREWREQPDAFWTAELNGKITPRLVLQLFGTDCMRRGFSDNIWVSLVKKQILDDPDQKWVIPDVRFYNEMAVITQLNGQLWQVRRGEPPAWYSDAITDNCLGSNLMSKYGIHESEYRWAAPSEEFNAIIDNNSDVSALRQQVIQLLTT